MQYSNLFYFMQVYKDAASSLQVCLPPLYCLKSVQQTTKGPTAQAQRIVRLFALISPVICLAKSFPGHPDSENLVSLLWRPL